MCGTSAGKVTRSPACSSTGPVAGPASGPVELHAGDLLTFPADVPHVYEALPEAHYVLLMSYP